jgi:dTDP-4-amino-4,6-dideoxygalactose transaminase
MIPLIQPLLDSQEEDAIIQVIRSGWVTQGPEVKAFEDEFAKEVNAKHAVAVSSCTSALHLALKAVNVERGDEVIVPTFSYIASANAVRYCNATPCFVDIDPITFNLDPSKIESAINPKTKAILCVHQMGMPCNLDKILEVSKSTGIPIVEDAACAIGSKIKLKNQDWENVGKPHGLIAAFSFHPRKVLTTGDGGMLTTNDDSLAKKFRLWRQHGMSVSDVFRHGSPEVIFEKYEELGYNYRMTDLQASIGRVQLKKLKLIVSKRREIASIYNNVLGKLPGVTLPTEPSNVISNWQSYCVRLADDGPSIRMVMQHLLDKGISTRRGIPSAHKELTYHNTYCATWEGKKEGKEPKLHESLRASNRCILLPLHHNLKKEDILFIKKTLKEVFSK